MKIVIYHNPQCSKSRETKNILENANLNVEIIEYLKQPPSLAELKSLLKELDISARELMRTNEDEYKQQNLSTETNDDILIQAMVDTPKLIERPIVKTDKGVVIGRPPKKVLSIL